MKVLATLPNDYEPVIRSINSGKPVVLNDPKCAYARDIRALAARLAGAAEALEPAADAGMLGRFASRFRAAKPAAADKGGPKRV